MLKLKVDILSWELREPFTISRGTMTTIDGVLVTLSDGANTGRGEAYGIIYEGETPESIIADIDSARSAIEAGISREELLDILPIGGARCAVDCALWDIEAKRSGKPAWQTAEVGAPRALVSAFTIGMRPIDEVRKTAAQFADFDVLKIKVNTENPLEIVAAARAGSPHARFIVDPNQSWSFERMKELAPALAELGVVLLEQPVAVDDDAKLSGYDSPIPICADELIHDRSDLAKARGKYSHINIKLDKSGGLTEGLMLAREAKAQGFGLMVGCMAGSSVSMAPAAIVGQLCEFVDLDGPLLQKDDWPNAMTYDRGHLQPPMPELWG